MLASEQCAMTLAGGQFRDERMTAAGLRHGVTTKNVGDMRYAAQRTQALGRADISVPCHFLKQVHGAKIHVVGSLSDVPPEGSEGDGWLVHNRTTAAVGVFTADCVPLFVWHPSGDAVGVYHAGWRGMQQGMARKAVESFVSLGYKAAELRASIGPHIKACCFQVSAEVARQFRPSSVTKKNGSDYVDLTTEALEQLQEAGVDRHAVAGAPACTACQSSLFFSYRRDKIVGGGRMMAFVMAGGK